MHFHKILINAINSFYLNWLYILQITQYGLFLLQYLRTMRHFTQNSKSSLVESHPLMTWDTNKLMC